MNIRHRSNSDSLELLLNTMCNTFGGIVMISLVMALLSGDASPGVLLDQQAARLTRQTADLDQSLAEARRLHDQLQQQTPALSETLRLLQERDSLISLLETQRVQTAALATTNQVIDLDSLIDQKNARAAELTNLTQNLDRQLQAHQRRLRLPRERATGKKTFYLVVRYGKLYPVHLMRNGQRELNDNSLDWRTTAEGETAEPRRELGAAGNTALTGLARLLNDIPSDAYSLHFLVYNDSFPLFLQLRQIPLQRNFDTGWEFLPADRPIIFSARGEAPPAL